MPYMPKLSKQKLHKKNSYVNNGKHKKIRQRKANGKQKVNILKVNKGVLG